MIIGNWKMQGMVSDLPRLEAVVAGIEAWAELPMVALCPPATLVADFSRSAGSRLLIGAQDCHGGPPGSYTGDVSAVQLADAGARLVIVGHSERRATYGESHALIRSKARAALQAGLPPILCVGETAEERKAGRAGAIVAEQLRGGFPASLPRAGRNGLPAMAVAYEPVWAIGSGVIPSAEEIVGIHRVLRANLERLAPGIEIPVLYGGSVKPDNAAAILALPEVGGVLVGGASLDARAFLSIIKAGRESKIMLASRSRKD